MIRPQYHFKKIQDSIWIWDVRKLIELSKDFPVVEVPLDQIKEIDEAYWYGSEDDIPTCRSIVEHMRLLQETDLVYPILLAADGSVMDGMHRVCKALFVGDQHIRARQFEKTPDPDFKNKKPDELEY